MARSSRSVRLTLVGFVVLCGAAAAAQPAAAQFGWFGQDGISSSDAYDTIASHGFRLVGPMMQNRDVYIADVVDRRQRRQRLIISRSDGRIVQRFMVDLGRPSAALPGSPAGGALPPRARSEPDFFSRLAHGFGDDGPPPRPPASIDTPDAVAPLVPRQDRPLRPKPSDVEPRLATRRDDAPVTSRPLAPEPQPLQPAPARPAPPVDKPAPVQQATPTVQPTPPAPARATVVTSDPLRIPGAKDAEKPAATAARTPEPTKPKAAEVPVVPLD